MNRNTILIVDDMEVNRAILRSLFDEEFTILEAENGEQGLMLLHQYKDNIVALLLDIVMPEKDGYEVMEEMSKTGLLDLIPVIVITAQNSSESEVHTFDLGASDIVVKPFEPHVVRRRVKNAIELNLYKLHLEEIVEEQAGNLRESRVILTDALSSVIEHRSIESGQHVLRIRMFTKVLLNEIMVNYPEYGLDEKKISTISNAAALHDIGKIAIPDAILNKPSRLTKEEFEIMKTHAVKGCSILAGLERMHDKEYLEYAYNICRYHHERWDGNGYPDGLKGENIPICAQAVSIADAYDALTTDRVYKKAYSPEKAYNMILNKECGEFSPQLLECFKNIRAEFSRLTKEYADGAAIKKETAEVSSKKPAISMTKNAPKLEQMKYLAMLRYENSTVMEVDIVSDVYHLVYTQNNDFNLLRAGKTFQESYRIFAEGAIHPEDRPKQLDGDYLKTFLTSGSIKQTRKYRVFHQDSGEYIWYEMTILRLDMENPRQYGILIVWREANRDVSLDKIDIGRVTSPMENNMIGILQCLNDRWFTICDVNTGFISLFGYSREELATTLNNHYLKLVHPEDRQNVRQQFLKQQSVKNTFEMEYRIVTKDGRTLWILEKSQAFFGSDGLEYVNCVMMDISNTKQEQETLRLSMERHEIIMDQTNDIIFEWDILQDSIYYSPNWIKKFGYQPISENISSRMPQVSHIMPKDTPRFIQLMKDVKAGDSYQECEIRIANIEGSYIWCRIRATTLFDNERNPIKAVGVILDIDNEKRQTQDLIEKAEKDHLTHLYNKNAASRRIRRQMQDLGSGDTAVMMIIDLDNFKTINDTFGHMFGDAVLLEVATQLRKLFRSEDMISRIGGDEFLVYVNKLPHRKMLLERADQLVNAMQNILVDSLLHHPLSCSVGIAFFPQDAPDFPELYQCCDRALYSAKAKGKNQYAIYDEKTMDKIFDDRRQHVETANTRIESEESYDLETAVLIQEISRKLYQSGETAAIIPPILAKIGRKFEVSRIHIFENSTDGTFCQNTFEWCSGGIAPQIDHLQRVESQKIDSYYKNFDKNGIFYCPNIEDLPKAQYEIAAARGISSLLQCAILNNGQYVGFIGFEDCHSKHQWNQGQIKALMFLAELLSGAVLRKRARNDLINTLQDMHTVLDTQNSYIYVIDPLTYEMLFINAKTRELTPEADVGKTCYNAFFYRDTPCKRCPAKNIRKESKCSMEIYNPHLRVWVMANASLIRWSGKETCLITCHDITAYKASKPERKEIT